MSGTTYFSPTVKVPVLNSRHVSQGTYILIQDIKAYSVDSPNSLNSKNAVIVSHDKFGFNQRLEQICDLIAGQGYRVLMPYFFQQEAYTVERARTESIPERIKWLAEVAPKDHIRYVTTCAVSHLKNEGNENFGILGITAGGKIAAIAAGNSDISAAVLIHTPWLTKDDVKDMQCPVAIIAPGDLEDYGHLVDYLSTKPYARKILHKRFPETRYGWIGSLSDFGNPYIAERATDVLQLAITFFRENIGIRNY